MTIALNTKLPVAAMVVNIAKAKGNLSKLVELALAGETIVIAKNNLPLVDLIPHQAKGKRKLGLLAGKFKLPYDFNDEVPEINAMFYGNLSGCWWRRD